MRSILQKIGGLFLDFIQTVVIALSIFVIVHLFFFQVHQVKGNSMLTNFVNGEYLLTDKISYRFRSPQRGEVIVFKAPKNEEYEYIKRIIALPGESVSIDQGQVFVNNSPLTEKYLPEEIRSYPASFLGEGQVYHVLQETFFVMGDNRSHSSDSREWGPVPKANIVGKVWIRYWPLTKLGLIKRE